eukprot:CAMPEP_0116944682 /NCGR_PEP_ID=MMETSP0467-20121206/35905_1 /TAXON_ID=283647 /ORGANISM="Mesodinium pulex, Strain SPMC105" /LENGTH=74 /DNA_ID=CAMNT_0004628055 /DNA_START=169 /DNA_END=393 /DNA_ORIENTATION=-
MIDQSTDTLSVTTLRNYLHPKIVNNQKIILKDSNVQTKEYDSIADADSQNSINTIKIRNALRMMLNVRNNKSNM